MKNKFLRHTAIALTLALMAPAVVPFQPPMEVHAAAAPKFNVASKTIKGLNKKYTLAISNKPSGAKYSWSSSNGKIATVNYKGEVTSVKKGSATIKCKITYTNKKTKTLSCKITVTVPATSVNISNSVVEDGIHTIVLGDKYDFNRKLQPSGSTDKTYWTIKDTSVATVDKSGIVTPIKTGTTILTATAASGASTKAASKITDQVVIRVVKKTASVASVTLAGSNQLEIKFTEAINESTVIDPNTKKIKDTIMVSPTEDSNKVKAADPGTLLGELSSDGKTLLITSDNVFNGYYDVKLTSGITTTTNLNLIEYLKKLELVDRIEPYFMQAVTDDTGLFITLHFSEAIDIANLDIVDVGPKTLNSTTTAILQNKSNYLLSEDKKKMTIDLSMIPSADRNTKNFMVQFAGIKDLAGNSPKNHFLVANFYTDTTPRAQARIVSIIRTGYNTLTVQYDRAIRLPGYLTVNGSEVLTKAVDFTDNKKVNYTLTGSLTNLTGTVTVSVGYWDSYNVSSSDRTADSMQSRSVSFNYDKSAPIITSTKLESKVENKVTSQILTLVFNKPVVLLKNSGSLSTKIKTQNDDIISNLNLAYTAVVKEQTVTLTLNSSQVTESGEYYITIPAGLVADSYNNTNDSRTISLSKNENNSSELSGPTSVVQSETNPSLLTLTFAHKLDLATATNISNYIIKGTALMKAEVIQNTDKGSIVELTFAPDKIPYSTNYELQINGIKGYSGNYTAIQNYKMHIYLKENAAPKFYTAKVSGSGTQVELTFSENIKGTASFDIYEYGKVISNSTSNSYTIDGNKIFIILGGYTSSSSPILTIVPTSKNAITDAHGNAFVNVSITAR